MYWSVDIISSLLYSHPVHQFIQHFQQLFRNFQMVLLYIFFLFERKYLLHAHQTCIVVLFTLHKFHQIVQEMTVENFKSWKEGNCFCQKCQAMFYHISIFSLQTVADYLKYISEDSLNTAFYLLGLLYS